VQHDIVKAPGHAAISDVAATKEQTFGARVMSSQPFWVTIALIVLVVVMTINEPSFGTSRKCRQCHAQLRADRNHGDGDDRGHHHRRH
jgi:hypothetical protein